MVLELFFYCVPVQPKNWAYECLSSTSYALYGWSLIFMFDIPSDDAEPLTVSLETKHLLLYKMEWFIGICTTEENCISSREYTNDNLNVFEIVN